MKVNILGVKVNQINMTQAVEQVLEWIHQSSIINCKSSKYIVTPNVEIIMAAQQDPQFRKILNQANLAIPDSRRFGWVVDQINEKNLSLKILRWPLFLIPQLFHFDTVTGTDLMEELIKRAQDQGFTIGLLGGRDKVAVRLERVLKKKYPKLKVTFAGGGGEVGQDGEMYLARGPASSQPHPTSSPASPDAGVRWGTSSSLSSSSLSLGVEDLRAEGPLAVTPRNSPDFAPSLSIPPTDLLFVAFGHLKQEKWIAKNLPKYPVKVMMGVGGAFDYLSGNVPRAPIWMRDIGFEWLFRLSLQPWRIKRLWKLLKFIVLITYK